MYIILVNVKLPNLKAEAETAAFHDVHMLYWCFFTRFPMHIDEKMKLNKNQQVNKSTYLVKRFDKSFAIDNSNNCRLHHRITSTS